MYLPAWNQGDKLLRALFVGLFLSVAKYLSLSWQNDSNISRPALVPGLAQSTSLTLRSTSMNSSTAFQSTVYQKQNLILIIILRLVQTRGSSSKYWQMMNKYMCKQFSSSSAEKINLKLTNMISCQGYKELNTCIHSTCITCL